MTLEQAWHTLDAAAEKYGVDKRQIVAWIEEGIIRSEEDEDKILRVNIDDLELKIHELTRL